MAQATRINWWEPYGETLKSSLAELRAGSALRPAFWMRIVLITAAVTGVMVAAMMYPGMRLPWPQIIAGLAWCPAYLAIVLGMATLMPRHVEVRQDWIQFTRGNSATRVRAPDIRIIALNQDESGVTWLEVTCVSRRGAQRAKSFAVSPKVDLQGLRVLVAHLANEAKRHALP